MPSLEARATTTIVDLINLEMAACTHSRASATQARAAVVQHRTAKSRAAAFVDIQRPTKGRAAPFETRPFHGEVVMRAAAEYGTACVRRKQPSGAEAEHEVC